MPSTTGPAGEYYVMSALLRRNVWPALPPADAPEFDILVHPQGQPARELQVKAGLAVGDQGWQLSVHHEAIVRDSLLYCFVNFGDADAPGTLPETCIVPSHVVATHVIATHAAWLQQGVDENLFHADGRPRRNDGDRRQLHRRCTRPPLPQYQHGWLDQYFEAWHLVTG